MPLPAAFLDELRARTPLPAVIGRRIRLARSGRQWKGCCPFHGEKTPSFYVYEDGHYPLLRLRRAWRCDRLRHAERGCELHRGG